MSNQDHTYQLFASSDCQDEKGVKAVQRFTVRSAKVDGGTTVNRLMPSPQRRMIGAWCFLDHAGPAVLEKNPACALVRIRTLGCRPSLG